MTIEDGSASSGSATVINGWNIYAHPLFLDQVEELIRRVTLLKAKHPTDYQSRNVTKRLAAIYQLVLTIIPQDPGRPEYRQGNTLGDDYKHWFRAKFFQQYRLFFRYHAQSKIIVFAWVNNEKTKRAYDSKSDAHRVFNRMLNKGHPPDDWDQLIQEARKATERTAQLTQSQR